MRVIKSKTLWIVLAGLCLFAVLGLFLMHVNAVRRLEAYNDDGIDNGGDSSPKESGYLPRFQNGKDWVWPAVATPEQVKKYEDDQKKKSGTK